jgi:hypothetical protein
VNALGSASCASRVILTVASDDVPRARRVDRAAHTARRLRLKAESAQTIGNLDGETFKSGA